MQRLQSAIVAAGVDAMPVEVAIIDVEGTIVLVNDGWRRFAEENHGTHPEHWVGGNYLEISDRAYEDPRAVEVAEGLRAILDGTSDRLRVEYPCHSPREQRWFMLDATGFDLDDDRYALVAHHNVTDRKRAELRAASRADQLETLLGVLTHDLRNPLNVIEGYATLLATELEDADSADSAERIRRAAARISEITEATLTFSRSGDLSEIEPLSVGEVATTAWESVATADATLNVCETPTVLGDRRLLLQLFGNLFRNSVEHSSTGSRAAPDDSVEHAGADCSRGSVTVTVGALPDGFYVEDDGAGIPEAVRARAVGADFSTQGAGGLGLAVVQAVVRAHGGTLHITDAADGGARFEITGIDIAPD